MENPINSYWMQQQQQPMMTDSYVPTAPVDQLILGDSTYLSQVQQQQQALYYSQLLQYQYNLWVVEQYRLQQRAWFQQQLQQQQKPVAKISEPQEQQQPFLKPVGELLCEIDDKLKVANGLNNPQEFSFFSYNTQDVNAFTNAFKNYGLVDEAQEETAGEVLVAEELQSETLKILHPNSDPSKCDTVVLQQGCNDLDAYDVQRYIGDIAELIVQDKL